MIQMWILLSVALAMAPLYDGHAGSAEVLQCYECAYTCPTLSNTTCAEGEVCAISTAYKYNDWGSKKRCLASALCPLEEEGLFAGIRYKVRNKCCSTHLCNA